jgi:hypothetical protein
MPNPESLDALLGSFRPDPGSPHAAPVQKALWVARYLQERARILQTPSERRQQAELDRMLQTPSDKATLALMTDQAFRTSDPARAVEHLTHILDVQGVPRFFGPIDRTLMKGFQSFGGFVPGVALPLVKGQMHKETANVILPGEKDMLTHHLGERRTEGVRMNVNFLGEAILSEPEAERRLQQILQGLQWPEIEVVSIKISTVYSQISPLAREHTVSVLCDRLERLFRTADRARFTRGDGTVVAKFVYLDMEEYRDKELTAAAFMRTLDRDGLGHVRAGIALQSYIPDAAAGVGAPARRRRRRAHHDPPREGREHGKRARRVLGARLATGTLPHQARDGCQLQAHGPRGHAAGESRRHGRRHCLAQPLRHRLRAGAGARAQGPGQGAVRDAGGHGERAAPRAVRTVAQPAAVRTRLPQGELHQRDRLPDPPP